MISNVGSTYSSRVIPNGLLVEFHNALLREEDATGLADELQELAETASGRTLYLNFTNVHEVAQPAWQQFLVLHHKLEGQQRRLCLLNLEEPLKDVFHAVERAELEALEGAMTATRPA